MVIQHAVNQLKDCAREVDALIAQAVQRVERSGMAIGERAENIAQRHREQELVFRTTIEKHKQAQQQAAERTELERRRNQLLARQQQQAETSQRITELYARRRDLLEQLSDLRDQRFAIRKAVAERINAELAPTIRVTIMQYGNAEAYLQILEAKLKGIGLRQGIVAQKIAAAIHPPL